jgi:hypothetical protein
MAPTAGAEADHYAVTVPFLLSHGPNHAAAIAAWRSQAERHGHVILGDPVVIDLTEGTVQDADGTTVLTLGETSGVGVTQVAGPAIPGNDV